MMERTSNHFLVMVDERLIRVVSGKDNRRDYDLSYVWEHLKRRQAFKLFLNHKEVNISSCSDVLTRKQAPDLTFREHQ